MLTESGKTIPSWEESYQFFESRFGGGLDVQGIVYLIGVQELGAGNRKFSKDEKLDVMHIAICKLLSYYGYYRLLHLDEAGWPHYERVKRLPPLEAGEQEALMKDAIALYLSEENHI